MKRSSIVMNLTLGVVFALNINALQASTWSRVEIMTRTVRTWSNVSTLITKADKQVKMFDESQLRRSCWPLSCPYQKSGINEKETIEHIKNRLKNGMDINECSPSIGITALWLASQSSLFETAKFLLDNGAKVDAKVFNIYPPLWIAAQNGYENIVELLLQHKANVDPSNETGITPLWVSAQAGHTGIVQKLIAHKANVNAICKTTNTTAVHIAVEWQHVEMVKLLVESGANPEIAETSGATPFLTAATKGPIAKALLKALWSSVRNSV